MRNGRMMNEDQATDLEREGEEHEEDMDQADHVSGRCGNGNVTLSFRRTESQEVK
ncbi:hypothetical protein PPNSA23_15520 [Phyllobacterium phragmitis]|uniref:Uncharacterized protein n=1 Tax=Phyllobacterium phragmitis TaxID=2670329 RepID=A0ABQ0GY58_9HYPH